MNTLMLISRLSHRLARLRYASVLGFALFFAALSPTASAVDLSVSGAQVTRVQVYETSNNTAQVWIHLNGTGRVGPNPTNGSVTCELWTYDKTVHATALTAMLTGKRVDVTYVDNSNGSFYCKVHALAIVDN
jgi:hypothetical protein